METCFLFLMFVGGVLLLAHAADKCLPRNGYQAKDNLDTSNPPQCGSGETTPFRSGYGIGGPSGYGDGNYNGFGI